MSRDLAEGMPPHTQVYDLRDPEAEPMIVRSGTGYQIPGTGITIVRPAELRLC